MRIGILADSHGRAEITGRAVSALRAGGAELLLHLGDLETDAVIDELVGHPARFVFGNCDYDTASLARYARDVGVEVDGLHGELTVGSKRIVFTHGHLPRVMQAALADGAAYLLHGHTHVPRDERIGDTRVINPGALFRAERYTAAILDVPSDHVELLEIPRG